MVNMLIIQYQAMDRMAVCTLRTPGKNHLLELYGVINYNQHRDALGLSILQFRTSVVLRYGQLGNPHSKASVELIRNQVRYRHVHTYVCTQQCSMQRALRR